MRKIKTFFYCLLQGIRNVWKNRMYSLASMGTIAACLLLLGIFYFVSANFNYILKSAERMVGVTVFFVDGTGEDRIFEIRDEVRFRAEVADIVYISAAEAWEKYKQESLNPELASTFGTDNPLENSASLEVYLNDVKMQSVLVHYLEGIPGVRKVNHSDSIAEGFSGIRTLVLIVSFGLIIMLAAVAVFLIRTTISIGISVHKEEISIMSLIGASDFFIRAPFVVEGILIGLFGSVFPIGILYVAYSEVIKTLTEQFESMFQKLEFVGREEIMRQFIPLALIFSVGLGYLASYLTSRRQIREIALH